MNEGTRAQAGDGPPLVRLRGVTKRYGQGAAAVLALAGIDLDVRPGEMVALVGPSGSGKSTLMHVLGLLDRPTSGTYLLGGRDVSHLRGAAAAQLRGRRIGFVFQAIHLLPSLTALRNVELPMVYGRLPRAERRTRALAALRRVGLAELAQRVPQAMSGGQAQRVAVARAVAAGPDLLLADEPTGALDRRSGRMVLALFQELHAQLGLTVVIVTHDPLVARHTQRIVTLEDGHIVADTPVTDRLLAAEAGAGGMAGETAEARGPVAVASAGPGGETE
jgi:putative ABC transport system ATP-binding protein